MSKTDNKFNEFASKLKKESKNLSKNLLFDLSFKYGIQIESIEFGTKIAKYGSYVSCGLGLLTVLIGLFASFYGRNHLIFFGCICILHLTVGPFAYLAFDEGKRYMFMLVTGLNQLWLGFALVYFISYLFLTNTDSFNGDVMHHFLFILYLVISIGLQAVYALLAVKLIIYFEQKNSEFKP